MPVILSVVMPMYNEEANVEDAVARVSQQLAMTQRSFEIICVNDGSTDATGAHLDALAAKQDGVVPIHLSRNFGKESALAAGLQSASGQAVIVLDADMQHPPELIPQMVSLWEQGHDIVKGRKAQRAKESLLYRFFSHTFYQIIGASTGTDMTGASDFGLFDRQVVDQINALPERDRFFRGLVNWVGFRTTSIDYEVVERQNGSSRWSSFELVRYAFKNMVAFTTLPLYITAVVGVLITLTGFLLGVHTFYNWATGTAVSGFTTVILLIIFFAGFTILSIGIVAVYLANLVREVKARPYYIVRKERPRQQAQSSPPPLPGELSADK